MNRDVVKLVDYRLTQARETLEAARDLFRSGRQRDAVNRAYYAMFYASLGLLASRMFGTSRHSGVLSLFGEHFVKTGAFSPEAGRHLRQAFEIRQKCDYQPFVVPHTSQVAEIIESAASFLDEAQKVWATLMADKSRTGGGQVRETRVAYRTTSKGRRRQAKERN